ncbi:unnamed protein product, partial [Gongylonema pulchrum]|uniref:Alpha/beta hydrolase n=1 Tax=Gongylonema pulchrum TaxID=637853 RepID=A0A183D3C8_9BILA
YYPEAVDADAAFQAREIAAVGLRAKPESGVIAVDKQSTVKFAREQGQDHIARLLLVIVNDSAPQLNMNEWCTSDNPPVHNLILGTERSTPEYRHSSPPLPATDEFAEIMPQFDASFVFQQKFCRFSRSEEAAFPNFTTDQLDVLLN